MSAPGDLRPDDADRIAAILDKSERSGFGVSADLCRQWRTAFRNSDAEFLPHADIDTDYDETTVRRHVFGNCDHDDEAVGAPGTSTDFSGRNLHDHGATHKITADECARWRDQHDEGRPPADIAETVEWSKKSVQKHIYERCNHP